MSRSAPQLNIRSAFAREKATAIARRTGMTTTEVVEAALRAYEPPAGAVRDEDLPPPPPGMVRKGWLLVMKSRGSRKITLEETLAGIDADREARGDVVSNGG
jgi:hypothetical protein